MKKCPTCDKTYEDSMRFCQIDGTSLVDDTPFDPYATIVARPQIPAEDKPAPAEPEASEPIAEPDDLLDLPEQDPLKTMYVSDDEMKAALGGTSSESEVVEIPPIEQPASAGGAPPSVEPAPEPERPQFTIPEVPAPNFGDISPPPSPFSTGTSDEDRPVPPPSFGHSDSSEASFDEAATVIQPSMGTFPSTPEPPAPAEPPADAWKPAPTPAEQWTPPAASPVEQWTPPPAPEPSWQNEQVGSNTPFQPPMTGVGGPNKTLAIISLVCGIVSLLCCNWFVVGIAAVILGYVARGKAKTNPAEFGGEGLALAGMITGGISAVLGLVFWIMYLFFGLAGVIGSQMR